jgi:uncharacterized protein (TIGR03435 family)
MKTITMLLLTAGLACAWQSPAFEVAEIKPSDPNVQNRGKGRILPGGRIEVPAQTVRDLMSFAYGVQDEMIIGGPKWASEERFDIVAKAPGAASPDTLRQMLQALLAQRFQLKTHSQDKLTGAYVLTVSKTPPGVRKSAGGQTMCQWSSVSEGVRRRECHNMTLTEFAKDLPNTGGIGITLPVKDETGLTDAYDFEFEVGIMASPRGPDARPAEDIGPTIFAAMLKMGLRLQERKIPMPAIVIDAVERPAQ